MIDETGKQVEAKPVATGVAKPSRRQIAMLGAAAPVLLTLPIRKARATGGGGSGGEICDVCTMSTFSAELDNEWKFPKQSDWIKNYDWIYVGKEKGKKKYVRYKYKYSYDYSCIEPDAKRYKTEIGKQVWDTKYV